MTDTLPDDPRRYQGTRPRTAVPNLNLQAVCDALLRCNGNISLAANELFIPGEGQIPARQPTREELFTYVRAYPRATAAWREGQLLCGDSSQAALQVLAGKNVFRAIEALAKRSEKIEEQEREDARREEERERELNALKAGLPAFTLICSVSAGDAFDKKGRLRPRDAMHGEFLSGYYATQYLHWEAAVAEARELGQPEPSPPSLPKWVEKLDGHTFRYVPHKDPTYSPEARAEQEADLEAEREAADEAARTAAKEAAKEAANVVRMHARDRSYD